MTDQCERCHRYLYGSRDAEIASELENAKARLMESIRERNRLLSALRRLVEEAERGSVSRGTIRDGRNVLNGK
jgi:plasmid stabilization system protein ParE